jgi:hypothetical protein
MRYLVAFALMLLSSTVFGSHLRAGYIVATRINCSLEYLITLNVYVNTQSGVDFGLGRLSFGDGNNHTTPSRSSTPVVGQSNVGLVQYSMIYTYASHGAYTISYAEINRNADIVNIMESVSIPFYLQTEIIIDPFLGCFSSPRMTAPAIFTAVEGVPVSLSYGVNNPDGIVYDYALITPSMTLSDGSGPVPVPYTFPENTSINPFNGLFTWDTKYLGQYHPGEYVFTIKIRMWKKQEDDTHLYLGHMIFDTQVNLIDDPALPPDLSLDKEVDENGRLHIPTDESQTIKIICEAVTGSSVELYAYSELSENNEAFAFTTYDSTSASAKPIKVGLLTLNSTTAINREAPYLITVRGLENSKYLVRDMNIMLYTQDVFPETIIMAVKDVPQFDVYPNPTTDKITVKSSDNTPIVIHFTNLKEEKVGIQSDINSFDLVNQPPGLYILKIETPRHKKVVKVIKR